MRLIVKLLLFLIFASSLLCNAVSVIGDDSITSPQDAWQAIDEGALILDVRTDYEVRAGRLKGSLHIPYDEIEARSGELPPSKQQRVVIYCASGNRAAKAINILERLGYTDLMNAGGYDELIAPRPEVSK